MATPKAQAAFEEFYKTLGGKPVHHTLATHWARVIEMIYAAERIEQLLDDPEITSPEVRRVPTDVPKEGMGVVEAPRGTLFHHYQTDERGLITMANLIVATQQQRGAHRHERRQGRQGTDQGRPGQRRACSTRSRWPSAPTTRAWAARRTRCRAACRWW